MSVEGIPWSHLVPVPKKYQSLGCGIEDTSQRGITLDMLEELFSLVQKVLDAGYEICDKYTNERVTIDTINLYHIDEHFVRPLTKNDQCSFVELAATTETTTKLQPIFFVSHWWGTPLIDTIRMLQLHSSTCFSGFERLRTYSVWICAFANRQHNLDQELPPSTPSYHTTPFAKAILSEKCLGTILLLNETDATPLERSWCIFEAFVSLTECVETKKKRHRFDIATIIPEGHYSADGRKNLRCAGLLSETHLFSRSGGDQLGYMSSDHPEKEGTCRPASFPLEVAVSGLQINIMNAKATMQEDDDRIKGWVGSKSELVNLTLQKKFIVPAMCSACLTEDNSVLFNVFNIATRIMDKNELIETMFSLDLAKVLCGDHMNDKWAANCFKFFIERGWDPNRSLIPGYEMFVGFPLGYALEHEQYETFRVLVEAGADPGKLTIADLVEFDSDKCPDDITAILREAGVLTRARCLHSCCCCTYCYLLSCLCCCTVMHPSKTKEYWRSLNRTDFQ